MHKLFVDAEFSMRTLWILEREGLSIIKDIEPKMRDFQAVLQDEQPNIQSTFMKWLSSHHILKHTWKNLLLVLQLINLDHTAERINDYFCKAMKQLPDTVPNLTQYPGVKGSKDTKLDQEDSGAGLGKKYNDYCGVGQIIFFLQLVNNSMQIDGLLQRAFINFMKRVSHC